MPAEPGQVACIGGPVEALNSLINNFQAQSVLSQLMNMCNNVLTYVPKLDFFPKMNPETTEVDICIAGKMTGKIEATEDMKAEVEATMHDTDDKDQSCSTTCKSEQELKLETGPIWAPPGQQNEDRRILNFKNFHFDVENH